MPVNTHWFEYLPNNHTYHWLLTITEYSNTQDTHASILTKPLQPQNCRWLRSQYHHGHTHYPVPVLATQWQRAPHISHSHHTPPATSSGAQTKEVLKMQIHGKSIWRCTKSSFTNVFMPDCAFHLQKTSNVLVGSIDNMYNIHTYVWKNQAFDISQISKHIFWCFILW